MEITPLKTFNSLGFYFPNHYLCSLSERFKKVTYYNFGPWEKNIYYPDYAYVSKNNAGYMSLFANNNVDPESNSHVWVKNRP